MYTWLQFNGLNNQWVTKLSNWCLPHIIGHLCKERWNSLWSDVKFAKCPKVQLLMWVCICLYRFFLCHGWMSAWTLYFACLEVNEAVILFLQWRTGFWRWLILFLAKRWHILLLRLCYTLNKCIICMVFLTLLCPGHEFIIIF